MCLINSLKVTSWDLNAMSDLQTQLLFKDIQTKKKRKEKKSLSVTSSKWISETITCLASGSSMLYWVPAGPSLTLSPRRKPRRVINVLAASSTDGGGPSSWLDSPAEAKRRERGGGGGRVRKTEYVSVVGRNRKKKHPLEASCLSYTCFA